MPSDPQISSSPAFTSNSTLSDSSASAPEFPFVRNVEAFPSKFSLAFLQTLHIECLQEVISYTNTHISGLDEGAESDAQNYDEDYEFGFAADTVIDESYDEAFDTPMFGNVHIENTSDADLSSRERTDRTTTWIEMDWRLQIYAS
ncbi:unnamed protein product [Phytophthora fragariaefolia]|uniref:Unnamed protein product n=1 Tax=Phytophthora fragariaefolia TaxID=1490495 RepID=A0A9W6YQX3_9STRA|nr:unnamed protein product [Phytophthora fragariaefolia]